MNELNDSQQRPSDTAQPTTPSPRTGVGAVVTTACGFIWLGWGFSSVKDFPVAGWVGVYVAAMALIALSVRAVRKHRASAAGNAGPGAIWTTIGKAFTTVLVLQGLGCGLVVFLSIWLHRMDLMAAGISFVVGMHFLPLARLLRFPLYYATGTVILLCDIAILIVVRSASVEQFVCITTGSILWLTALCSLFSPKAIPNGHPDGPVAGHSVVSMRGS